MAIQIVPGAPLKPGFPEGPIVLEAGAGKTVAQVLEELAIDADLVAVVLVNGHRSSKDVTLRDGDVVKLVPFVGGG